MTASNDSDTVIVILHEIYGMNEHILNVCQRFEKLGYDVMCPDLLDRSVPFSYEDEESAYEYFTKNVGFDSAAEKLKDLLGKVKQKYRNIFLVGFSIGATVAWMCSSEGVCQGIIGYYGSRIRNYTDIIPKCPVLLIFAAEEKSFNPKELMDVLNIKKNVNAYVFPGKHGFSNPYSKNYYEQSDKEAARLADEFLKALREDLLHREV